MMGAGKRDAKAREPAVEPVVFVPRINIHAFCEIPETENLVRLAFADRRMSRAHAKVTGGGIPAAVRHYETEATPSVLIVESRSSFDSMMASLASLAEVCHVDTKVIVIGHANDVILFRELIRQGVSEYIIAPFAPLQLVEAIALLYRDGKSHSIGRVFAFIGVKGGTGSSTIAHNCAREIARTADVETAIIDLDLAFGTAALNFNIDTSGEIVEAISQPTRVDTLLLDRLLVQLGDKLSLLGGPGGVDGDTLIDTHAVETILGAMRSSVPAIIVDIPNIWAPWVKFTLLHADRIVLTSEPDLAGLRNAKSLIDLLNAARPNDPPAGVVLNKVGMPSRPEIAVAEFQKASGGEVIGTIPFDPRSFGAAANKGRLMIDLSPRSRPAEAIRKLARGLAGEMAGKSATAATKSSFMRKLFALGVK